MKRDTQSSSCKYDERLGNLQHQSNDGWAIYRKDDEAVTAGLFHLFCDPREHIFKVVIAKTVQTAPERFAQSLRTVYTSSSPYHS